MIVTWYMIVLWMGYALLMFVLPGAYLGWVFVLLGTAWLADMVLSLREPKLTAERRFIQPSYQHREHEVTILVFNPLRRKVHFLLKDEPPFESLLKASNQGRLLIAPEQAVIFSYTLSTPKRGAFYFANLNVKYPGPLGLFCRVYAIPLAQKLDVYPDLEKLSTIRFNQLNPSEINGEHRRKIHSLSGEFTQLREFTPGDDLRKVNWKVTAHFGKPIVNEFEPEKDQNVFLCFDTGRQLYDQLDPIYNRMDYILDSALLLSYQILEHGDMVGALGFNAEISRYVPAGKGKHHLELFIRQCYDMQASMAESDYREAFNFLQNRLNKRCLLFIYTDITEIESSRELIDYLKVLSRRHLVVCVMLKKNYLVEMADQPITDETSAYQKGVALDMLRESRQLIRYLSLNGVKVLEADSDNIAKTVTEHYLYLKRRGLF